jgi:hypothetical protein
MRISAHTRFPPQAWSGSLVKLGNPADAPDQRCRTLPNLLAGRSPSKTLCEHLVRNVEGRARRGRGYRVFLRQAQMSQPTIIGLIVDPSRILHCSNGLSRAVHHSKISRPTFGSGSSASILVQSALISVQSVIIYILFSDPNVTSINAAKAECIFGMIAAEEIFTP